MTRRDFKKPISLYFNITNACNSACTFCAERSPEITARRDIPISMAIEALERFQLGPCDDIVINGGEPTLYRDLPELVQRASDRRAKVVLFTNGRKLEEHQYAHTLLKAGVFRLSVPLHGRFPRTHDSLTLRPGSFLQTLRGLRNVYSIRTAIGYPYEIELKLLALRQALPEWPAIVDFVAQGLGSADTLVMSGLNMWSTAVTLYNQFAPTIPQMQRYVNQALDRAFAHQIPVVLWAIPLCILKQAYVEKLVPAEYSGASNCERSTHTIYFDPDYPEGIEMPDFDFRQRIGEKSPCRDCIMLEVCGTGSTFMQELLTVAE